GPKRPLPTLKKLKPFAYLGISIYVALQTQTGLHHYSLVWNGSLENGVTTQLFSPSGQHLKLRGMFQNCPHIA
ncbi:hypothetical protein AVEN_101679-1, partial [Araneus ventricosus]